MKYAVIFLNIYYLVYILLNIKDIKTKLWYIVLLGELVMSANVLYFISRWKLAYIDFCLTQILATRCTIVFVLFKIIRDKAPGFENVDPKMLYDAIYGGALPAFIIMAAINWKV